MNKYKTILMTGSNNIMINRKWYDLRWLIPLLFVFGYIITFYEFSAYTVEYLFLNVFCLLSCLLLLSRLGQPFIRKLPFWIILFVFLTAYFLKFYLMVIFIEGDVLARYYLYLLSEDAIFDTFVIISSAFFVFCITSWFLIGYSHFESHNRPLRKLNNKLLFAFLKQLVIFLMIVTTIVSYIYGLSKMAAVSVELPFRLAGWFYYIRITLIPLLLLVLVMSADKSNSRKDIAIGISLLLLHGLSDVLIRGSRGSILNMMLMLTFLFIVTEQVTMKRVQLFFSVIGLTIIFFPIVTVYRAYRTSGYMSSLMDTFGGAVSEVSTYSVSYLDTLMKTVLAISNRFIGAEALLVASTNEIPLGWDVFSISVHKYFTNYVLQIPSYIITGFAPSLLGWFYLVGGQLMVIIGMLIYVVLAWSIWRALLNSDLHCKPVAQALFLFILIGYSSGGLPGKPLLEIIVTVGSVAVCEYVMRLCRKKKETILFDGHNKTIA